METFFPSEMMDVLLREMETFFPSEVMEVLLRENFRELFQQTGTYFLYNLYKKTRGGRGRGGRGGRLFGTQE